MKRLATFLSLLCLCTMVSVVAANEKDGVTNEGPGNVGDECPLEGYKVLDQLLQAPIGPDADCPTGQRFGPIQFTDGPGSILDAIIDVDIEHTWASDLEMQIVYDVTCDGQDDVVVDLFVDCGGSADPLGLHLFSDDGPVDCAGYGGGSGCFQPLGSLSDLDGLDKGGCWYLQICDDAGGDGGVLWSWSVHLLNEDPVAVDGASWGSIKAVYNER